MTAIEKAFLRGLSFNRAMEILEKLELADETTTIKMCNGHKVIWTGGFVVAFYYESPDGAHEGLEIL